MMMGISAALACVYGLTRAGQPAQKVQSRDVVTLSSECPIYGRMNCNESKCCAQPGLQCYEQNQFLSQCRESCAQGPDPSHWDANPWSCKEKGSRSPGQPPTCSKVGEDCRTSQCCADPGLQCYEKNSDWAMCKKDCAPNGPDLSDSDGQPWTCKALGERKPTVQPWAFKTCAKSGKECTDTKCCASPGEACFMQNEFWGICKSSCDPKYESGWSCDKVGYTTPTSPPAGGMFAPWVMDQCSKPGTECTDSKCCLGMDSQCYRKNKYWAACKQSCKPGKDPLDKNEPWSCDKLGPRGYGLAIKGSPSLYCFAVFRTEGYEVDLMKAIYEKKAGIFACDGYSMLTADGTTTISGEDTTQFHGAPIIGSVDGTAGNTELFVNVWTKVVELGMWSDYAFTVKADPDAVFIPIKLRWHLGEFVGKKMYIINCAAWNMIYGALEVFSYSAIQAWSELGSTCNAPADFGEDKYMTQCMDHIHVSRVDDFGVLGDKLCGSFTDCKSLSNAAFHPFKDVWGWLDCWQTAMNVIS